MSKLSLNNVKIKFPEDFIGYPTDIELVEWLEYELGSDSTIKKSNPLSQIELKDCIVTIGEAKIDGKPFIF